ncbi:7319_t:CDS:2, partial [Dentiscutata heterogama]
MASIFSASSSSKRIDTTSYGSNDSSTRNKKLETVLSKPHSKQWQQKLTWNIVKFFLTCTLPLSLIENKNF